jgi:hypothetical protein
MLQRPPRRPQSSRRKCSVDLRTPSPLDSGYFSTEETCECPQNHRKRCFPSFDGPSLDEFPASKFLENELQILTPIVKREEGSAELSKTPETRRPRERAEVVSPFIYSRSSGRLPLKDKRVDANRRKLDRYVPKRDPISPSSERYRTTKQSQDLSRDERLKRDKTASADPFVLKRHVLDPDPRFPFRVDDSNLDRGLTAGALCFLY